jgi:hypothetical protein
MGEDWRSRFVCCHTHWRIPSEQGDSVLVWCVRPSAYQFSSAFFYNLGGRTCCLMQIVHLFSSSLTTLLLTASKLVALLLHPNHLISFRFRPLPSITTTVMLSLQAFWFSLWIQDINLLSPIGCWTIPKKRHVPLSIRWWKPLRVKE